MSDEIKYAYIWDGEKGKSGDTPQITVAKDGDDYYWKLNGNWLTDPDTGEKIRANGHDGISAAAPLLKLGIDITTGTINP